MFGHPLEQEIPLRDAASHLPFLHGIPCISTIATLADVAPPSRVPTSEAARSSWSQEYGEHRYSYQRRQRTRRSWSHGRRYIRWPSQRDDRHAPVRHHYQPPIIGFTITQRKATIERDVFASGEVETQSTPESVHGTCPRCQAFPNMDLGRKWWQVTAPGVLTHPEGGRYRSRCCLPADAQTETVRGRQVDTLIEVRQAAARARAEEALVTRVAAKVHGRPLCRRHSLSPRRLMPCHHLCHVHPESRAS
jgi:hypothetical protein